VTGIVGTVSGGLLLDYRGATVENALKTASMGTGLACLLLIPSFMLSRTLESFVPLLVIGELFLFMSQAPASAVMLWSVPKRLRPFSMSLTTITIHVLGDVPSPPILGAIQGRLENWRLSFSIITGFLLLSSAIFLGASIVAKRHASYQNEGSEREGRHNDVDEV